MPDEGRAELVALRDAREDVIARLSEAFAKGDIEMEEFERRITLAHRTDSPAALRELVKDLEIAVSSPAPAPVEAIVPVPARSVALAVAAPSAEDAAFAIMGSVKRTGNWTPPRVMRVMAIMGEVELDFREAVLAPGVSEVVVTTIMGQVNVIVPPMLAVEMSGSAIMGSFEHAQRSPTIADPDRPILRVRGVSVMGAVEIKTRLPGESGFDAFMRRRREKKALREARKTPLLERGKR